MDLVELGVIGVLPWTKKTIWSTTLPSPPLPPPSLPTNSPLSSSPTKLQLQWRRIFTIGLKAMMTNLASEWSNLASTSEILTGKFRRTRARLASHEARISKLPGALPTPGMGSPWARQPSLRV
ncbi:hypothetical protein CRG98_020926 [Punica granatum]|uniref:Uncharacterized protein n=1 Tax=Punica granatum TaxID=22663 RepID=A0A2I0JS01_PUNGR|nr:hypothetical protein CRG98_020926 [Punica granatum]